MAESEWKKVGESTLSPTDKKERAEVKVKAVKKENIVVIGSEEHYSSFLLKMMFMAGATHKLNSGLRKADNTVIAYVKSGYTDLELGVIESYKAKYGCEIKRINSLGDFVALLNRDRENVKIQDLYLYCHGLPNRVSINYGAKPDIDVSVGNLSSIKSDIFSKDGILHSFACRMGVDAHPYTQINSYKNDSEVNPESSLAMKMAKYFNVTVKAFLTRTDYSNVVKDNSVTGQIEENLDSLRKGEDKEVYTLLNGEYEALHHVGLSTGWRGRWSGVSNYALWRKQGGRQQPVSGKSPSGLSHGAKQFKPDGTWS
ncbi:hypothetical protein NRL00_10555 [Aeromonas dhakensis]|uniref:hypothetical protein n=1 Tax=Aeromonas dhakensis TaxID=196024 RepID=UPI00227BD6FE|nr:hypothetical protein [Aeromonas dhakensis]WAF78975.1 hypothetical protein NRL00_10555 [Aeromonas dhakensis]